MDGFDCSSCKTAKTNMLRLSASLGHLATIAVVNCAKDEASRELCYTNQSLPRPPHSAMTKIWPRFVNLFLLFKSLSKKFNNILLVLYLLTFIEK